METIQTAVVSGKRGAEEEDGDTGISSSNNNSNKRQNVASDNSSAQSHVAASAAAAVDVHSVIANSVRPAEEAVYNVFKYHRREDGDAVIHDIIRGSRLAPEVIFGEFAKLCRTGNDFGNALPAILSMHGYRKIFKIDLRRMVVAAILETMDGIDWVIAHAQSRQYKFKNLMVDLCDTKYTSLFDNCVLLCIRANDLMKLQRVLSALGNSWSTMLAIVTRAVMNYGVRLLTTECHPSTARILIETWEDHGGREGERMFSDSKYDLHRLVSDFVKWVRREMELPTVARDMLHITEFYPTAMISSFIGSLVRIAPLDNPDLCKSMVENIVDGTPIVGMKMLNCKILLAAAIGSTPLLMHALKVSRHRTHGAVIYTDVVHHALEIMKTDPAKDLPSDTKEMKELRKEYKEKRDKCAAAYGSTHVLANPAEMAKVALQTRNILHPKMNNMLPLIVTTECLERIVSFLCTQQFIATGTTSSTCRILPNELVEMIVSMCCHMGRRHGLVPRHQEMIAEKLAALQQQRNEHVSSIEECNKEINLQKRRYQDEKSRLVYLAMTDTHTDPEMRLHTALHLLQTDSATAILDSFKASIYAYVMRIRYLEASMHMNAQRNSSPETTQQLQAQCQTYKSHSEHWSVARADFNKRYMQDVLDVLAEIDKVLSIIDEHQVKLNNSMAALEVVDAEINLLSPPPLSLSAKTT